MNEGRLESYFSYIPFFAFIFPTTFLAVSYALILIVKRPSNYILSPSDLGINQPEQGIYTIALTLGSVMTFTVQLLRYIQINSLYPRKTKRVNFTSFICGVVMICAQVTAAAFSQDYEQISHYSAGSIYFVFGCIYMITQTYLSQVLPMHHIRSIVFFRLICTIIGCISPIIFGTTFFLSKVDDFGNKIQKLTQWVLLFFLHVFICSFSWDFNRIKFNSYSLDKRFSFSGSTQGIINNTDYPRNQTRINRFSSRSSAHYRNSYL
nr:transmembrane protein 150A-like [Hydra vulgaris]